MDNVLIGLAAALHSMYLLTSVIDFSDSPFWFKLKGLFQGLNFINSLAVVVLCMRVSFQIGIYSHDRYVTIRILLIVSENLSEMFQMEKHEKWTRMIICSVKRNKHLVYLRVPRIVRGDWL